MRNFYSLFGHDILCSVQIVGFRVEPMSIKHSWEGDAEYVPGQTVLKTCNDQTPPSNDPKNYQSGTLHHRTFLNCTKGSVLRD